MTITRTLDAAFLNRVANDPDVRPWIGGDGLLDLTGIISDANNFALQADHGGWVFVRHDAGTYELHTLFTPAGRGAACLSAWKEAVHYMFVATDAREIVTRVPENNRGADFAARRCGFRERFARPNAFKDADGRLFDVSFRALTVDDWAFNDPEALAAGEMFHAQLEAGRLAADAVWPEHPDDEAHDRAAGASCLMIAETNTRKGVWFYNRWAALAGYPQIRILTETPLTLDVGSGVVVGVSKGTMEVIRCPSAQQ